MKLGLVGLGHFNVAQHAPSLVKYASEVEAIELVLCEPSSERLSAWRQRFGEYPAYESADAMLDTEELDAAYVTVPPAVACEVTEKFLRAGVPSFTEKPPGMTAEETQRLIDAAGDLQHAVGFNRRFSPVLRKMKEIAASEDGEALFVGCEFTRVGRYDPDFTTTLIHGIDAVRAIGGDLAELSVRKPMHDGEKPFRNYHIGGTFASGALLSLTALPVSGRAVERYTLVNEHLTVAAHLAMPGMDEPGEVFVYRDRELAERHVECDLGMDEAPDCVRFGFFDQARQFLDAVQHGGVAGTSFRESLQSVEVAEFLRHCPESARWTASRPR